MSYYFAFEATKFRKNPKNIFLLVLVLTAVISGVFYLGSRQSKEIEKMRREITSHYVQFYSAHLDFEQVDQGHLLLEDVYHGDKITSDEVPAVLSLLNSGLKQIDSFYNSLSKDDWREKVSARLSYLQVLEELKRLDLPIPEKFSEIDLASEIEKDKFFLKENIKPDSDIYGYSGIGYANYISGYLFSIFGVFFLCLLFFDLYRQEYENNTIRLVYTLPLERLKIIKTKMRLSFLVYMSSVLILLGMALLAGSIYWKSFGTIGYPVVLTIEKRISSLPTYLYFFINLALFSLFILLILHMIKHVSITGKGMSGTFLTTAGITIIPCILTNTLDLPIPYAYFNPFYFSQVDETTKRAFETKDLLRYSVIGTSFLIILLVLESKIERKRFDEIRT